MLILIGLTLFIARLFLFLLFNYYMLYCLLCTYAYLLNTFLTKLPTIMMMMMLDQNTVEYRFKFVVLYTESKILITPNTDKHFTAYLILHTQYNVLITSADCKLV